MSFFFGGSELWEANAGDGELMRNALGAPIKIYKKYGELI